MAVAGGGIEFLLLLEREIPVGVEPVGVAGGEK